MVKGCSEPTLAYLYNYIGVRPGTRDPYDESAIVGLEIAPRELPFVQPRQQPYVGCSGAERTKKLYLFLDHRRAPAP